MGGTGGILNSVALVILDEMPGWCARQNDGRGNISQDFS